MGLKKIASNKISSKKKINKKQILFLKITQALIKLFLSKQLNNLSISKHYLTNKKTKSNQKIQKNPSKLHK